MSERMRKLIQEKYGFVTNLPTVTQMHDDVTEGKKPQPSAHPLEGYRKVIKALLGSTTTQEDGILENAVDFTALHRLANKHGFAPSVMNSLNTIDLELNQQQSVIRMLLQMLGVWLRNTFHIGSLVCYLQKEKN
jgi:hypothetical protein